MAKEIRDEQLDELTEYFKKNVVTHRLFEVRQMVMDILRILGIEIKLR